jgi:hypothetical protein
MRSGEIQRNRSVSFCLAAIAELAPGVSYTFNLMTYDNMPRTGLVRVTWTDENGGEGEWQSTLHTPIGR